MSTSDGYKGTQRPESGASQFNAMSYLVESILNRMATATLVNIISCTNSGGISAVGFVDVQPLVHQIDGNGNIVPHGIIHHVPYFRLQGGANAVIIDPQQGDIGICIFAHNDISAVKDTGKASAPGSHRRYDWADGLYMGGFVNGAPTQYIAFSASGILAVSPTKITCQAPEVDVTAGSTANVSAPKVAVSATGSASVTAPAINLGANGQTLQAMVTAAFEALFNGHTHTGNGAGAATSAPVQQMDASHMTSTVKGG